MKTDRTNHFNTKTKLHVKGNQYTIFSLPLLEKQGLVNLNLLPFSIRVLLENMLRNQDEILVFSEDVLKVTKFAEGPKDQSEIPFMPARVVLQDFTGVPAVVDLAAMRDAIQSFGKNPDRINPIVQSDLVIDHSVQVDRFGTPDAFEFNVKKEFERNSERYLLLKWAQKSFRNFRVVPPGTGIVHQVNLEYLAKVVLAEKKNGELQAFPDTLVGTDSHTTMINGLSVLGWGVGGIEAEAVMLGQPYYMLLPEVVGVKLTGELPEGTTATDLVLTITEQLRKYGVVGKFVEYFGSGLSNLSLPDRATIANMSPEYGATMGFFPIDEAVLSYLQLSGRPQELIDLVEYYAREQGMFRTDSTPDPQYTSVLEIDMSQIEPSMAGPKRPQDRVALNHMKPKFFEAMEGLFKKSIKETEKQRVTVEYDGQKFHLQDGSVVIAAITSCTNTSNPAVMMAAGLVARKALERGLFTRPWVKTSLAPGSRVVTDYLEKSGLLEALNAQRFNLVGYGCTTCIGNSGPLPPPIDQAIKEADLVVASVLSGNRNFEGRVHPSVRANYLASPPLVVVYALAGRIDIDLENEPLGVDKQGNPVFLRDIWPTKQEIQEAIERSLDSKLFIQKYQQAFEGDENWKSLPIKESKLFEWQADSTYIKRPPFFENMSLEKPPLKDIENARVLVLLGDTTTTDHISPAGAIPANSPAGQYLISLNIDPKDFNSFGSRRGNHEVMMRGTFGNIRIRNMMLKGVEGGYTLHIPSGEQMFIYNAAMKYKQSGTPLVVIAGKEYGTGSSRDWAAKGTALLGVKAVIAESFERIHRSNLIGMGVLPLQFLEGDSWQKLGLTGHEIYHIQGIKDNLKPGKKLKVTVTDDKNQQKVFEVLVRLDSHIEVEYYQNGGILQTVLRQMIKTAE
ncbi:MAG: aconitate hydratase AcnA [Calditrichia bacterium]